MTARTAHILSCSSSSPYELLFWGTPAESWIIWGGWTCTWELWMFFEWISTWTQRDQDGSSCCNISKTLHWWTVLSWFFFHSISVLSLILTWLSCETAYSGSCPFFSVADWEPFPLAQVSSMISNLLQCQWISSSTCWSPICFSKSKEATFSCTCFEIVATGFLSFDKLTPDSASIFFQALAGMTGFVTVVADLLSIAFGRGGGPSYFVWKKPANNLSAHVWTQTWSGVGEITVADCILEYFFS